MFHWEKIPEKTLFGMTVKMYRDPFVPLATSVALFKNLELDHYAYKYMGSELYLYRILDTNFIQYIEERGDISNMQNILIPLTEDTSRTIL